MKRIVPLLGWLVVATIVALVIMKQLESEEEPPGTRELYYALAPGEEITIRLLANEPRLRILAHLETPDPGLDDEAITWLYGLQLTLEPTDGEPQVTEHWTRSRRTILADGTRALLSTRDDTVITDSRIVELEQGHLLANGGLLRVQPLLEQPNQRLLLRVYRERPAQALEQTRLLGSPDKQRERTETFYPFSWDNLELEERLRITGWVRERLHAETQTAESVPVHRLAPPSPAPTTTEEGWILQPGAATAVNLRGPVTLNVATELLEPQHGETTKGVPLRAEMVDASEAPFPDVDVSAFRWSVPPGALWSLRWTNPWEQDAVLMRFTLAPPAGQSWGEPPGAGGEQPQAPELRRLAHFRADKGMVPIVVPVATGADWGSLRVDVRPLPPPEWIEQAKALPRAEPDPELSIEPVTVSYRAFDEDGELLGSGTLEASFEHAPFETYVESEQPWVSEETQVHLFHPFRATTLQFTADGPVDLRFLVPVENEPVRSPQYALPEGWTGRYAPWELAPYVAIAPLNTAELIEDRRLTRLDATVRIVRSQKGRSLDALHTVLLEPVGDPPRYPAVERFRSNQAPWQGWHRTELGDATRLLIPDDGQLSVDYRVPAAQAGHLARLSCGEQAATIRLPSSGGVLHFAGLPTGWQSCQLNAPAGQFLARAQGSGDRWVRRTLYRGDATELRLPVQVDRFGRTVVYVRAYTPRWAPAPTVTTLLDDGRPRRHGGPSRTLSRATRTVTPEPGWTPARLEDRDQGELRSFEGIRLVLGDDLVPGQHVIRVKVEPPAGEPYPVYLRFDSTHGNAQPEQPEHWAREVKCELAR